MAKESIDDLKKDLIDRLVTAENYQDIAAAISAAVRPLNHEYYSSKADQDINYLRPECFIHVREGEKIVKHNDRYWFSTIRYDQHAVFEYGGERVLYDAFSVLDDAPSQISIKTDKLKMFIENDFFVVGYIVKASESLRPVPGLDNLPTCADEVGDARSFSMENVTRPLGNLYYNDKGESCAEFAEPQLKMDVWGRRWTRKASTEEFKDSIGLIGAPRYYNKVSCEPRMALTKYEYFVAFEKNMSHATEHSVGISVRTSEPDYHLKFETFTTDNFHDEFKRIRERRLDSTGES